MLSTDSTVICGIPFSKKKRYLQVLYYISLHTDMMLVPGEEMKKKKK